MRWKEMCLRAYTRRVSEFPRRVAKKWDVPFVDLNKLTHDLVVNLGVEKSKSLFMWVPAGIYDFCPKGKIDNTHLNIYGGKVSSGKGICYGLLLSYSMQLKYPYESSAEVHAADIGIIRQRESRLRSECGYIRRLPWEPPLGHTQQMNILEDHHVATITSYTCSAGPGITYMY